MPDGQESVDRLEIEDLILRFLPANDSLAIDKAIDDFRHGVDVNIRLTCNSCNQEFFTVVPPGPEFFRPTRFRVENTRESVRTDFAPVEVREPRLPVSKIITPVSKNKAPRNPQGHVEEGSTGTGEDHA
jgi:hypothetical protein